MKAFTISAKNLAAFNLSNRCDCCLWYLLHINFRKPWSIFPGIFSSFDSRQKRLVHLYLQKHKAAPKWFGPFKNAVRWVKPVRMEYWDQATNITIIGVPDEFLEYEDGSLAILDFKTGRYSKGQDALLDLYKAQLSAYCLMAPRYGYQKPTRAGLLYFEPCMEDSDEQVLGAIGKDGFAFQFTGRPVEVPIDTKNVEKLLKAARKLYDLPVPPESKNDCKDCENLAELYRLCHSVQLTKTAMNQLTQDGMMTRSYARALNGEYNEALRTLGQIHQPDAFDFPFADVLDWRDYGAEGN